MFPSALKTAVSLINSSPHRRSRTTTAHPEMLDYVSDVSGATEGRGAREPASKARGFNSISEGELAS